MSQEREQEIRLQFLEEAQEYLDTIESVLLEIGTSCTDSQMDGALRAAHSVKGGAAMMGFETLSSLAHRFEDFFKVLKSKRRSLTIDAELEGDLLSGLDCLSYVVGLNRQGTTADDAWIESHANPIFSRLSDRLGEPDVEAMALSTDPEDGLDMVTQLFESEVEGSLQRLEDIFASSDQPCLLEEVSITAQELGGLGEMLELPAFSALCESIVQAIAAAPEQIQTIAAAALQTWRRSQALILIGQMDILPTQLDWAGITTGSAVVSEVVESDAALLDLADEGLVIPADDVTVSGAFADAGLEFANVEIEEPIEEPIADFAHTDFANVDLADTDFANADFGNLDLMDDLALENFAANLAAEGFDAADFNLNADLVPADAFPDLLLEDGFATETPASELPPAEPVRDAPPLLETIAAKTSDVKSPAWVAPPPVPEAVLAAQAGELQDNTVRVGVRQLDQLNDLFGELTIERNGISLHLDRLRNLVRTLGYRMRSLEQSNIRLRTAYDKVATESIGAGFGSSLTLATSGRNGSNGSNGNYAGNGNAQGDIGSSPWQLESRTSAFDILEMDHYSDLHLLSQEVMETIVQIQEVTSDIDLSLEDADHSSRDLNRTARQLQTSLTQVRMRPLSDIVGRFPRAIRDLSREYGKPVELKIYGGGTLIDRVILEALSDPLMHLLRNAFDHGIEDAATRLGRGKPLQGTIEIRAAYRGNRTLITLSEDGGGINLDKIRARAEKMGMDSEVLDTASDRELLELIFEPGFSTASQVTALSGRGVGMDVVRTNLQQVRGEVRVDTKPGLGTTFTISVPFTLSVVRVLLVESNGMMLALPKDTIEEMILAEPEQTFTAGNKEFLNWEGYTVPLVRLSRYLAFNCPFRSVDTEDIPIISTPTVLMISQGEDLTGIEIDRCWGEQEVAVRQVEGPLPMPPGFSGCTILGNGRIVPLVDAAALLNWVTNTRTVTSDRLLKSLAQLGADGQHSPGTTQPLQDTILVIDDSINVRRFLKLTLQKAGYRVEEAKDGQDALDKLMGGLSVQAVMCDIEMPRLDGFGFLARVKADPALSQLPVSMLTSRTGDKHRQLAMNLGASAYFSKPFKEQDVLQTLKQLIHRQPAGAKS